MQDTRESILAYLGDHPPSSAVEISRYLEMTPANIRYHLDILKDEGLVCLAGSRTGGGSGRPILLYTLTSYSLGDNLNRLLSGFLGMLENSQALDQSLTQVADQLIQGQFGERGNRVERFNQGVDFLNSMHYHASWEARLQGPRVELRHCPYQDLAQEHPVLCQLDERLIQSIFGVDLKLVQRRTYGKYPHSPCIFS